MSLFQSSVVTKLLQSQDKETIAIKWNIFKNHFHNPITQENIRNSKEEQYQGGFIIDLFVNVLGYTKNPTPNFNITTEYKNVKDSKKADGAIIINNVVKAVVELKGTNTTDLGKVEAQAFGYKNNQPSCNYIITSNFEKLRFYIDNAIEHIEFNLFTLTEKEFELLYLCLAYENIERDIPKKLKTLSISEEDVITKKLYNDYSLFKRELYQNLVTLNPQFEAIDLFKKSQKLLDRFLFLFFSEDRQLLPPNSVRLILKQWKQLQELDEDVPLYNRFKKYFEYLNTGFKGKKYDVFAYNGGLFKPDEILDTIKIDDTVLFKHTKNLSEYDFQSEVDVNILGHIFENSLNELDEIKAELEGEIIDKTKTKRKKDGVFYTPKYITKYIVENTVGKLCEDKKIALQLNEDDYITDKKRQKKTVKGLIDKLTEYRNWLLQLTICDPACGSGAFLNQALNFLIDEHKYIDELQAKLFGDAMVLSDVEKSILENNLFGVDLNEESVEIAKLSLWLRTAQPNRKLNDLNNNIKCGNSLIDDSTVAGEKAFNWQQEFPQIFAKGGFDVVIGNPPYKAGRHWEEKDLKLHGYLSKVYKTSDYQLDLYVLFYERSLNLIKSQKGLLSFIAPNTWFTNISSKGMRRYFLNNAEITQILDCSKVDVFEDAVVETAIVTMKLKANSNSKIQILQLKDNDISPLHSIEIRNWLSDDNLYMNIYVNEYEQKIKLKIDKVGTPLGDFCEARFGIKIYEVGKGTPKQTKNDSKNKIYESNIKINDDYLPLLEGKDVNRYNVKWNNRWIKYGKNLAAPRSKDLFEGERFLVRRIMGNKIISCWTEDLFVSNALLHCVKVSEGYNSKVVFGIISSSLMAFYYRKSSGREDKAFPEIKVHQLRSLPIVTKDESLLLEPLVDKLLDIMNQSYYIINKFQIYLKQKLQLDKLSKKLQNWYNLEFGEFIKEINKAIKLANKQSLKEADGEKGVNAIYIPTLTKKDEFEWLDLFEENKLKAQELQTQINQTDKEIDAMVYELYGLSEEEIKIVEGS